MGRRFFNVTQVNILCLCKPKRTLDGNVVARSRGGAERTCLGIAKSTLEFLQESQFNIDLASFRFVLGDCFDTEKSVHIKALERWSSIDELGSHSLWLDLMWQV